MVKEKKTKEEIEEEKEKRKLARERRKNEERTLRNILLVFGVILVVFLIGYNIIQSVREFEYKDVEFETIREGDLIFYRTSVPITYDGRDIDYNFYLRNDPRKLERLVSVEGEIVFRKNLVMEVTTENLFCDGDWSLAIGNLHNLYQLMGVNWIVYNESEEYSPAEQYMFITINEADVTEIRRTGDNTYDMNVNNCEILPVTERLMVETLVRFKEVNK